MAASALVISQRPASLQSIIASFSAMGCKKAGFGLGALIHVFVVIGPARADLGANELVKAGFAAQDCQKVDCSIDEFCDVGLSAQDCDNAGFGAGVFEDQPQGG